jgi:hypothetical protein
MLEHEVGDVGARDHQDACHAALQQNQESNDRLPEPGPAAQDSETNAQVLRESFGEAHVVFLSDLASVSSHR